MDNKGEQQGVNNTPQNKAEQIKGEAIAYLSNNYADNFNPVGYEGKSWAYNYDTVSFSSEKYNGQNFNVYRFDGEPVIFTDDYFKLVMNEDASQCFADVIKESFFDAVVVKIQFNGQYRLEELPPNASFSDYLSIENKNIDLFYFTNTAVSSEIQETLVSEIVNKRFNGNISFIVTDEAIESMQSSSLDSLLNSVDSYVKRNDYFIQPDFTIVKYDERHYCE